MNEKLFKTLEMWGIPAVFLLATFFHEIYIWSGRSVLGSLIGAVNESVWEHLKIFAEAYLIWAAVELLWATPPMKKIVVAKTLGVCMLIGAITLFFYTYTFFTKKPYFVVDITSSLLFVALAQAFSMMLTMSQLRLGEYFPAALMMLGLIFVMILCFSYYPPKFFLFRDNVTGGFGVKAGEVDGGFYML